MRKWEVSSPARARETGWFKWGAGRAGVWLSNCAALGRIRPLSTGLVPVPVVSSSTPALVMVRTKADCMPGSYRKVVAARAPRKALGHSSFANTSPSPPSRKVESKYAGGNPVCVRPTPTWQKGIGEFFGMSSKHSEKENQIPDEAEAGNSGLGKPKRK
uniref:PCNA-associated factor n=2 Tax=Vombatus ursinus TaxID=29139 RepID=A0A4X2LH24_VOMUR